METLKALFTKPDPQAQLRKCNAMIRSNLRKLDRDIGSAKQVENKTKTLIIQADRRAQRDAARSAQAQREVRGFARELLRTRRTTNRLITSKAQLNSVQLQVNEAFAMKKIEGSIRASVVVMRDVNSLVRLPELAGTMRELGLELVKAGVIEEMVHESLPEEEGMFAEEEDEAEGEIDKVLGEILRDKADRAAMSAAPVAAPAPAEGEDAEDAEEGGEEDPEAMMDQMRLRLEALRS